MKNTNGLSEDTTQEFSLDSLEEGGFSLEDVNTSPLYDIKTSDVSNKQLATNTALLKGDPELAAKAFTDINTEMSIEGSRKEQEAILEESSKESAPQVQEALVNVLLDDTVSPEGKEEAVRLAIDKTSDMFSVRNQLSVKNLAEPLEVPSEEGERVRGDFSKMVDEVNEQLKGQQQLLNSRVASVDANTSSAVVEFFEAMLPFGRGKLIEGVVSDLKENLGDDVASGDARLKSLLQLGGSFQDVQELIKKTPLGERAKLTEMLADIIDSNNEILIPDENGFAKVDLLRTFLEEGYYEEGDAWVDTVVGLLDISLLGGPIARLAKGVKGASKARTMDDIIADLRTKRTFYGEAPPSPTSAGANATHTNPDKARVAFEASQTDDGVAKAFYGTTSEDVAYHYLGNKPMTKGGVVEAMPSQMGRNKDLELTGDPDILEYTKRDGRIYYTEATKKQMRSTLVTDFQSAVGLTLRENVTQVGGDTSDFVGIKAVYSHSPDTGWESAKDAINQTLLSLRKYGITEKEVTLLVRSGTDYVPFKSLDDEALISNDYITQVDYRYEYNPADIVEQAKFNPNYSIFDRTLARIPMGQAPLHRFIKDASSIFEKEVSLGGLRAEDRSAAIEKQLVTIAKGFDDVYLKLPPKSQQSIHEYVKEANYKGLKFNEDYLNGRGFNQKEIGAIREWKKYWDSAYELENADMTARLVAQNWELYRTTGTNMLVRRVPKGAYGATRTFYDGISDSMVTYSNKDIDELYKTGSVMEVKTPIMIDGKEVNYFAVPQTTEHFTRRLREEDHILNYREGYYAVQYKDPWFIEKIYRDAAGNETRREVVARAGSSLSAEGLMTRLNKGDGGEYSKRPNNKQDRTIQDDIDTINISQGRSSQRMRGQRVRDASGTAEGDENFIVDPVESMLITARSLSNRIGYSQFIEASKKRWVDSYGHMVNKEKSFYKYPMDKKDISKSAAKDSKEYLEAVGLWEHFKYLESGFVNGIDEFYKARMRDLADSLGARSVKAGKVTDKLEAQGKLGKAAVAENATTILSEAEQLVRTASQTAPMGLAKNIAFQSMLALNPLRQLPIQGSQAMVLIPLEPAYAGGRLALDIASIIQYKMGTPNIAAKAMGVSREEMDVIVKAFDDSGLTANVDRHNLVNGALTSMADSWTHGSKAQRATSNVLSAPRKVGFDAGEMLSQVAAWLTFRHRAIKAGQDFSRTDVQADVAARARDFTGSMNFAGDFVYNQNSMSMFMQFMQAPHKMMTLILGNKNLTAAERARIGVSMLVLTSLPPAISLGVLVPAIEDIANEEVKEIAAFGLAAYMMNAMTSKVTGTDTRIDFSSFSPLDMYGFYEVLTEFWLSNAGEAVANTPAMSMIIGHNPRITDAYKGVVRFFHPIDDGTESPETFAQVMEGVASISSGYSNYMKFRMAQKAGHKLSSTGKAYEVSKVESWFLLFGLSTQEQTEARIADGLSYSKSQAFKEDFDLWYKENKRVLSKKGIANNDTAFEEIMLNKFLMHFKDFPEAFESNLLASLRRDAVSGDDALYKSATRNMGIMDEAEFKNWISVAPMPDETKTQLLNSMKMIQHFRDEE